MNHHNATQPFDAEDIIGLPASIPPPTLREEPRRRDFPTIADSPRARRSDPSAPRGR